MPITFLLLAFMLSVFMTTATVYVYHAFTYHVPQSRFKDKNTLKQNTFAERNHTIIDLTSEANL